MSSGSLKIAVVGFGVVGQGFFELFHEKRGELGLDDVSITEIIDARYGHILDPGSDATANLRETGEKVDAVDLIRKSRADVVCEFTWVNYDDAEPAVSHIRAALESGKHVITTNKGPLALHFSDLMKLAGEMKRLLKFKGTVMAGTPSFNVMDLLPGAIVKSVRGVFNGTTNFILARMDQGSGFDSALKEAQEKGYAEADPVNDVDGLDSGAKVAILSSLFGWPRKFSDVSIEGIRKLRDSSDREGFRLIGYADGTTAYVRPEKLSPGDPLYHVNGVANAIELDTDTLGRIMVTGPGAGKRETAQAALTDLVSIIRETR